LYEPERDSLYALGTSNQPLSALQKKLGLDLLALSNGGRVVYVFKTGNTFATGHLEDDGEELRGVKESLKIRSKIGVPLEVGGVRRGMLMIASKEVDYFKPEDVRFAESVARWVSIVVHRAELVEEIARNAAEQGRRAVAEELITVLAHDLRNVISPIDLRLHMLHRRAERDQRQADVRELDAAAKAVARLSGLISDILDVARIDQGILDMDVQPVDAVELIQNTAATLSTSENPIVIKSSEDVILAADPARVLQCLENLLSNAVKHSPKGAPVTVLLSSVKHDSGDFAIVDVVDEGPGVPPEIMPRLFERFVTGGRSNGGLGLGLYLAKRIAVMHQGELTVSSEPGKGARFRLMLPKYSEH
jgi:two-component system, OmpR family, sensor kinase